MPSTTGARIRDFLPDDFEGMEAAVTDDLRQAAPMSGARLAWGFVAEKATEQIQSALDEDIFEVLAHGWSVIRELRKFKDPKKYPADKTVIVHLAEHKLPPLTVHPELQIMIGALPGPKLRFTVEIAAQFRALALGIRGGYLTSISAGDGTFSVQLKYGEVKLHKALKPAPVELKLSHTFKKPVAIA